MCSPQGCYLQNSMVFSIPPPVSMPLASPYHGTEFKLFEPTRRAKMLLFAFFVFIRAIHPTAPLCHPFLIAYFKP